MPESRASITRIAFSNASSSSGFTVAPDTGRVFCPGVDRGYVVASGSHFFELQATRVNKACIAAVVRELLH